MSKEYMHKFVTPEVAAKAVQSGDWVDYGFGGGYPELMDKATGTSGKVLLVTTNAAHKYQDIVTRTVVLPYLPPSPELCPVSPVLFSVFAELLDAAVARRKRSDKE